MINKDEFEKLIEEKYWDIKPEEAEEVLDSPSSMKLIELFKDVHDFHCRYNRPPYTLNGKYELICEHPVPYWVSLKTFKNDDKAIEFYGFNAGKYIDKEVLNKLALYTSANSFIDYTQKDFHKTNAYQSILIFMKSFPLEDIQYHGLSLAFFKLLEEKNPYAILLLMINILTHYRSLILDQVLPHLQELELYPLTQDVACSSKS